ncbi:hypothetical protein [Saccharopolyspora gloriosae]|uniref:hypothetical protein n=1 Tax=Saccharopolyspora gloriosae TaxID=455344 RepID=UPI001FB79893|nr:hypothetical protein [Saccharopolyspora gloriosae]
MGRWPAIVVGAPGEASPEVNDCARLVNSLPEPRRTNFGLVVYGWEPTSARPFAQRLAERLQRPVHHYHGMPFHTANGTRDERVITSAGRRTWRPFIHLSVHRPGCPPVPREWRCPAPGLVPDGIGSYRLAAGWMVDVLASGLLIRPVGTVPDSVVELIPPHPGHVNLVLAAVPPPTVLPAVERMVNSLPAAARSRIRLVAASGVDPAGLGGLVRALHVEVHALGKAGRKWPSLVRRFVRPAPGGGIGEPREGWACGSCDTNNLGGVAVCRRCRRGRDGTASKAGPSSDQPNGQRYGGPVTDSPDGKV